MKYEDIADGVTIQAENDTEILVRRLDYFSGSWVYDLVIGTDEYRSKETYANSASAWADARRPQLVSPDGTLTAVYNTLERVG
jgi:hypothetical protein